MYRHSYFKEQFKLRQIRDFCTLYARVFDCNATVSDKEVNWKSEPQKEDIKLYIYLNYYPHAFLKKRRGYCYRLRPSARPLWYTPKPLDEIQPNLVCELLSLIGRARAFFFCPAPWGPGEGSKGQISFIFNYKVIFKDFYTKLCVCTHKWKIQNIPEGIFILLPGSCPRGGRGQNQIPSWCLSVMLSPSKPLDEMQPNLVCELLP